MTHGANSAVLSFGLFFFMLVGLEVGRRLGSRRLAQDPEGARAGISTVEGSIFGLVGLLIAFTFSGAAARFDTRRELIAQEANAIGTAWLRLDMLAEGSRPALRDHFRAYLDARIETFRVMPDFDASARANSRAVALQNQIWSGALAACADPGSLPQATVLLVPALNDMIDITTTREMATKTHPPRIIFVLLFVLTLASAVLAGYDMAGGKRPSWAHMLGFAATMALAIYVTLDLENPRAGFIRVDSADQVLIDLRTSMDAPTS